MITARILVVDDEELIRWSLEERLTKAGYEVTTVASGRAALEAVQADQFDLLLLDYRLPDLDGLVVLRQVAQADPDILVILMTAYGTVESVVQAFRSGAYDYINKPFDLEELLILVEKALETTRLRREVRLLRSRQQAWLGEAKIVGQSPPMEALYEVLPKLAASDPSTILITGESGTGKELVARAIHALSPRAGGPFTVINCTALPEHLVESELFGHEKGAFTDAKTLKKGQLEVGDEGTVFLDEIGELSVGVQAKLLRFLEEKSFKRVGGTREIKVDLRVVAATNRHLEEAVQQGEFRQDLYYRLKVLPIHLPPLRERKEDIPLLVNFFLDHYTREFKKRIRGVRQSALNLLMDYHWPGNVRELKNLLERAVILSAGPQVTPEDLPQELRARTTQGAGGEGRFQLPPQGINMEDLERSFVQQAMQLAGGNQTKAAKLLGLNRDQLRYRLEKYGLKADPGRYSAEP